MDPDEERPKAPHGDSRESGEGVGKWVAVVFVVALAALSVYVINTIIAQVQLQNCVLSGRRDCVTIVPGDSNVH
jgi:hypothetical protein